MADNKRFTFFENWGRLAEALSDEELGRLVRGMCAYAFGGAEPEFERGSTLWVIWMAIWPNISNSVNGSANGAKGGRPKGPGKDAEAPEPKRKPSGGKKRKPPAETPSETPTETSPETHQETQPENPTRKPPAETPTPNRKERKGGEVIDSLENQLHSLHPPAGAGAVTAAPPGGWQCPKCKSKAYVVEGGWKCPRHGFIEVADPVMPPQSSPCPDEIAVGVRAAFAKGGGNGRG